MERGESGPPEYSDRRLLPDGINFYPRGKPEAVE
jgi:hypothetical protein